MMRDTTGQISTVAMTINSSRSTSRTDLGNVLVFNILGGKSCMTHPTLITRVAVWASILLADSKLLVAASFQIEKESNLDVL